MTILKELWTGEVEDQENVSTYQYVIDGLLQQVTIFSQDDVLGRRFRRVGLSYPV